jgi:hypothetical protein
MKCLAHGMALLFLSASLAFAQEQALVVSSTPVVQLTSDQQSRIAYYNVVYEYAGKRYSVQMPSDPGNFISVQVTPMTLPSSTLPLAEVPVSSWIQSAPSIALTPPVTPIYVSPYPPAYFGPPPFMFSVGVGYHRGYGRHWR